MASLSPLYIRLNPDITPLQDTCNILIVWDIVSGPIERFASSAVAELGLHGPYGVEFGFERLDRGVSKTQLAEFGTDRRSVIPNSFDNYTRHFVSSGSGGELIINSSIIFGT